MSSKIDIILREAREVETKLREEGRIWEANAIRRLLHSRIMSLNTNKQLYREYRSLLEKKGR